AVGSTAGGGRSPHRRNRGRLRHSRSAASPCGKARRPTLSARLMSACSEDRVRIVSKEMLGGGWAKLMRYVIEVRQKGGDMHRLVREVEDHGHSVAVLPFDPERQTVLMTRQFRFAAHLNGHDGWLIEVCAGMIDGGETPENAVVREAREELGV